ncbi:GNAT family N-acetyltransferase [Noviherbaspirillum sedimenti]|nr:GNAT family N-acetyltransferase [Noviherbaspirillum sedimenti]
MENRVRVHFGFDALPAPCLALFAGAADEAGLFFSLPWLANLHSTALADRGLRIYAIESAAGDGAVRLALPLTHRKTAAGVAGARELAGCANFYSSLFGPALAGGVAPSPQDFFRLAQAIASEAPAWDVVNLQPMALQAPSFGMCVAAFRQAGMAVQTYFCFGNWYLEVAGRSYREYAESLPSRLKNTLARKSRQLAAAHDVRIAILADTADAEQGIAAFERVYRSSWKSAEAYPEFIPGLIRMCAQQGWLRLGVAYVDGGPAAAQLWIVSHGVASIYKLAYDARFAPLSIGSILTAHLMQHVIDVDRVREVDYLTGDDAYKRDWMSHRRERWGMIAFNLRTARGLLAAARHIGGRGLKGLWRRLHPAG